MMHTVRSETSAGQELSNDNRLRNVFIVFGALASIILVSHTLYATSLSACVTGTRRSTELVLTRLLFPMLQDEMSKQDPPSKAP